MRNCLLDDLGLRHAALDDGRVGPLSILCHGDVIVKARR
jgi:hypothetical protein